VNASALTINTPTGSTAIVLHGLRVRVYVQTAPGVVKCYHLYCKTYENAIKLQASLYEVLKVVADKEECFRFIPVCQALGFVRYS
jgi:hypothetical protein